MNMEKIKRSQFITYLDTSNSTDKPDWKLLGVGVTDYGVEYNPQVTTEKWIIQDNSTSELESNQKQGSVSQKCYKGDPLFEYVNKLRDKVESKVATKILDIDKWDEKENGKYSAKMSDGIIVITKYMGETAVIEYTLYYNGDPIEGYVTFADGEPTFTENVVVEQSIN